MLLYPQDSLWKPGAAGEFEAVLRSVGLIAAPLPAKFPRGFPAGENFLGLIMFLGCSPRVDLGPDPDSGACFLQLHQYKQVRFVSTDRPPAVRCPACRTPLGPLAVEGAKQQLVCPHCLWKGAASELDWRYAAAFASFFIEVHGIYPHEAVPADALLGCLGDYSQTPWKYIYV